jgi:hypothetical protein
MFLLTNGRRTILSQWSMTAGKTGSANTAAAVSRRMKMKGGLQSRSWFYLGREPRSSVGDVGCL